jgi:hypothetical protein
MITAYERSDIIHIMKMNRLTLSDSDTAHLEFGGQVKGKDYKITILVVGDLPQVFIKQAGLVVLYETVKSIYDLKIFFEERLYKYLEV